MSTVNLEQGSNYHIVYNGVNFSVEYVRGGKIYKKDVLPNSFTKPIVVDYCDERIRLNDGSILKRIRDNFIIMKE
ncbi:MAG: hypothetical protein J6R29_01700 [Clostridia bacterium]|nr:hypothetical protein [Clostridia bacterium]